MMKMLLLPTTLLASPAGGYAQNMNTLLLIAALQAQVAGLMSLATAAEQANTMDTGQQLLQALTNSTKNYTFFPPNNDTCELSGFMHLPPFSVFHLVSSQHGRGAVKYAYIICYIIIMDSFMK